jgi:hypothetical protein
MDRGDLLCEGVFTYVVTWAALFPADLDAQMHRASKVAFDLLLNIAPGARFLIFLAQAIVRGLGKGLLQPTAFHQRPTTEATQLRTEDIFAAAPRDVVAHFMFAEAAEIARLSFRDFTQQKFPFAIVGFNSTALFTAASLLQTSVEARRARLAFVAEVIFAAVDAGDLFLVFEVAAWQCSSCWSALIATTFVFKFSFQIP